MTDEPDNEKLKPSDPVTDDPGRDEDNTVEQAIGMEARVMLKSVHVPSDGPLDDELKQQIRETVRAHLSEHGITYREVSLQVGVGESTISEVLKGTYTRADDSQTLRKLNVWIDDDERRRARAKPIGFYKTSVFDAIKALATFAKGNARVPDSQRKNVVEQESSRIVIGWGPAGCGKSIGARALHSEDTLSILIRVQQRQGTDIGLARMINEAAGWRGTPRGRNMIEYTTSRLKNTGRLLIVDEGHRLNPSGCEFLRDLADVAGIPILILATEEFYVRLTKVRTQSGNLYYDQFSRRVGFVCDLIRGLDGKGGSTRPIFSIEEVKAIFQASKVRIDPAGADYLQAVACSIGLGMLGLAGNIFDLALRSALRGKVKVITMDLLRKSAKRVLIPAGILDHCILNQIDQTLQHNRAIRAKAV